MGEGSNDSVVRWERLLDLDSDLAEALGVEAAARARDRVGVATVRLAEGMWRPEALAPELRRAFGLIVCDGLIVRELDLAGTLTADLVGPGDIVALGQSSEALLRTGEHWHVSGSATVAILDDRVLPALHAWPALSSRLIARAARQAARAAEQRAISQLPRVELRIRALLWHLAERWGRMGPTGVVLPLELTHGALGHLVGARRPTVTLALSDLARAGTIMRRDDGAWMLRPDSNPSAPATNGDERTGIALMRGANSRRRTASMVVAAPAPPETRAALAKRLERLHAASAAQRARSAILIERSRVTRELIAARRGEDLSSPAAPE
jgi:CRP/FNR family cyclic AMP-dependent transcriptional regulator